MISKQKNAAISDCILRISCANCYIIAIFFRFSGRWTVDALYPYGVKTQFRFRLGNHVPDVLVHLQFLFAMKVYDFVCKVGKISCTHRR